MSIPYEDLIYCNLHPNVHSFDICDCLMTSDEQDTDLVEEPDGHGNDEQRNHIGRRSDDGRHYQNANDSVATVLPHDTSVDDAHSSQNSRNYWQFEDNAHDETHGDEGVHMRLNGQHVVHCLADLIGPQKTDGEREDEQVVQESA